MLLCRPFDTLIHFIVPNEATTMQATPGQSDAPRATLNEHKELMEQIKKEKEEFVKDMKNQEEQIKRQELEKMVNGSRPNRTGPAGITGGEPTDELTKSRRDTVKKVISVIQFNL